MLRSECRPVRAEAFLAAAPKLLAVSLGLIIAACSADVTRFDAPMFGLTGGGNRPTSALVPRESVYGGSRLAQSTPYDTTYRAPSYDRYAAAPQSPSRPVTGYAPASGDRYGSSYQPQPSRPDYRTPPYRTTYEAPPRQPFGSQSADRTAPSSYQPQPETRLAALPPPSAREPDRPLPSRQPVETTPPQSNQRSAPVRAAPSAGSLEIEVQPGDTLYGLAERHDISISELMTLNGLTNPVLRPGQKLMLPKGAKVIAGAGGQKSGASTSKSGTGGIE